MSGLSPERLTESEREVIRIKAAQTGVDSVLLYVEGLLAVRIAAEREAGAAEVRARVEALHVEGYVGAGWCAGCHDSVAHESWPCATRAALNGGE